MVRSSTKQETKSPFQKSGLQGHCIINITDDKVDNTLKYDIDFKLWLNWSLVSFVIVIWIIPRKAIKLHFITISFSI